MPRLEALLALDEITEAQVDHLISACERLIDPEQMGARYKVLGMVDGLGADGAPPAGFAAEDYVSPPAEPPVGWVHSSESRPAPAAEPEDG